MRQTSNQAYKNMEFNVNQSNYGINKGFASQTPLSKISNNLTEILQEGHPPHFLQTLVSSVAFQNELASFEVIITGIVFCKILSS